MADYIIVAALTVAVVFGIYSAIKYFNGHARSCGSAGYKPKKKKLSGVIYQKNFKVEGMHCNHYKNRVEEVVNGIKGIAGKVN